MSEGGGALELLAPAAPVVTVRGSLGAGFERGNNLHVLAAPSSDGRGGVVAYAVGNAVRVHDLSSGSMRYVQGRDGGGVGALAVHPSRAYFAVAERRWTGAGGPRIYVYAFPSLACVRVLEGGTERGFSDVCFSLAGGAAAALAAARAASASGQDAGAGGAGAEAPAALSPAGGEGAGDAAVVADAAIVADGTGAGAASSEGPSDLFVSVGSFPDYSLIVWCVVLLPLRVRAREALPVLTPPPPSASGTGLLPSRTRFCAPRRLGRRCLTRTFPPTTLGAL